MKIVKSNIDSQVRDQIKENGYLYIDNMMKIALLRSEESYYRNNQPLGEKADFITAPEISQMFGEMIGMWVYQQWCNLSRPNTINIVELGPGRGYLMRDCLKVLKATEMYKNLRVQLYDINQTLIELQKEELREHEGKVSWINGIEEISKVPTIVIANEFFDALPIKQYIKVKNDWREMALVLMPNSHVIKFQNMDVLSQDMIDQLNHEYINAEDGAVIEESIMSAEIMAKISKHMAKYQGTALIIDYGYDLQPRQRLNTQYYSTLQAVKNHKYHPILEGIGSADLTSHVDFFALKKIAKFHDMDCYGAINQESFLNKLGLKQRAKLLASSNPKLSSIIMNQYERLTSADQMGELFKVAAFSSDKILSYAF